MNRAPRKGLSSKSLAAAPTLEPNPQSEPATPIVEANPQLSRPRYVALFFDDFHLIVNNLDSEAYKTAFTAAVQCNCDDTGNYGEDCKHLQEQSVQALARQVWAPTLLTSQETLNSLLSVLSHLAKMPGDRVLLMASSGFYAGELGHAVDDVVNDALRSRVVINALDAKGLYAEDSSHGRMLDETPADRSAAASS